MIANLAALARDVAAALSLPLGMIALAQAIQIIGLRRRCENLRKTVCMIVYQKDRGDPIAFDLTGEQPPTRLPKKIRNNP
ncbi:hypothetical protein RHODGE_RHODGE_04004 [Rhodoplanes serenus]|uniref:Uncharacterized protein n=1 Tax=Rhodoplanes serenus TaxID=200615 RepID=A0A3S4FF74_9BRAD|nr:hypothetical protein [Rhodoplanes serenus]VCU10800.1 hypothetical protein RHODGE_RHODGE_04004 [Rhodoplanes serenus]